MNPFGQMIGVAQGLGGLRSQQLSQQQQREQIAASQQQQEMIAQQQAAQQMQSQHSQAQQEQYAQLARQYQENQDPKIMTEMILMNPELSQTIKQNLGAVDEQRAEELKNKSFAFKQALNGGPEVASSFFSRYMANDPAFQEFSDEIAAGQFDRVLSEMGAGIAAVGGRSAYEEFAGPKPELKATGSGYRLFDPETNQFTTPEGDVPLTPEQAQRETEQRISQVKAQLDIQGDQIKRADTLRNEVQSRAKELGMDRTYAAINRIRSSGGGSPAGDIALIFNYMKLLDPGSTVMQGEYANAQNATGIPERVVNVYNRALDGDYLNPKQRQDFKDTAESIYKNAQKSFEQAIQPYLDLGEQSNLTKRQILGEGYFESFNVGDDDGAAGSDKQTFTTQNGITFTVEPQ